MNFPFSQGPPGPLYTVVHLQISQISIKQESSQEEKVWADCLASIAEDPAWSFTLQGQVDGNDAAGEVVLIISWKCQTDTVIPSWTSTPLDASTSAPSSPLAPLLPLLESPPQILNVAFRPLLPSVNLHPNAMVDITTLYIPTSTLDTSEIITFNNQMNSFTSESAHVSHEPAGPMISSSRGWGVGEVERKGKKMVAHVLLYTWGSREEERDYKEAKDGRYESLFLEPLREAEKLGVNWEMVQVELKPVKAAKEEEEKGDEKRACLMM